MTDEEDNKPRAKVPLTAAIALLASVGGIGGGSVGGYYGAGGLPERVDKVEVRITELEKDLQNLKTFFAGGKAEHFAVERRVALLESASQNNPMLQVQVDIGVIKEQLKALAQRIK